jgi:sulfate permease, SulP family
VNNRLLPSTFRGYEAAWIGPDVIAGLTLVAIAVPEQIATARLANMPEATGLYAFIAGSLVFAVVGTRAQVSVGADSTIAPAIAVAVAALAAPGTTRSIHLASLLALMVGAVVVLVGLLRAGWISEFLSAPVVAGVLAGIAVEIVVRQIPAILGVPGGGTTTIGRLGKVGSQLGQVNGWSVGIAVAVFVVIIAAERVDRRIPGALIGLLGSLLVSTGVGLSSHGVPVVGSIHGGVPTFGVPSAAWDDIRHLIGPALIIAFLCVVQTAATTRSLPRQARGDFNRDLAGVGAGSVVAGFAGSFAVDSSPPRTEVVTTAGGRSQLAGLVAAGVVLILLLAATGVLKNLPQATLGAILIFVATRLFRVRDFRAIFHFNRLEFGVALVTLLVVAVFGIEQGVVVAMVLALADRTRRSARPPDAILGRVPGTDHWIPRNIGRPTEQVTGVVVFLVYAPLWYGDSDYFRARVREIIDSSADTVRALVLDADAIPDIDYTGALALADVASELRGRGVALGLARSSHLVQRAIRHPALTHAIRREQLYESVEEAVAALAKAN